MAYIPLEALVVMEDAISDSGTREMGEAWKLKDGG